MKGSPITSARKLRALSQVELAEKLGVSKTTLSTYERGIAAPGAKLLPRMAELLAVSPAYLRGVAPALPLYDPASGETARCQIVAQFDLPRGGMLFVLERGDGFASAIIQDGAIYLPIDQAQAPTLPERIYGAAWMDSRGKPVLLRDDLFTPLPF